MAVEPPSREVPVTMESHVDRALPRLLLPNFVAGAGSDDSLPPCTPTRSFNPSLTGTWTLASGTFASG